MQKKSAGSSKTELTVSMPHKSSAPELQLKIVQRNYDSISKLMHGKQQECDKVVASQADHNSIKAACVTVLLTCYS